MNALPRYAVRTGICIVVVIVYFRAWRPLRTALTQQIVAPEVLVNPSKPYRAAARGVSITVMFPWNHHTKEIHYRPQAGFFFLIAILTFIILSAGWKWYGLLAALHLMATIITAVLMMTGAGGRPAGFIAADFIGRYLMPVLTLTLAVAAAGGERMLAASRFASTFRG